MIKVCIISNSAPNYRTAIFSRIDKEWDCEWFIGRYKTDIKPMDSEVLKKVTYVDNKKIYKSFWIQKKIQNLIRKKDFTHYIVWGEPYNLSTWWFLIQKNLLFRKKKVYLWSHGWYGREGLIKKIMKKLFFGMADGVLTYGEYAKSVAILQGFDSKKIYPIHNSLDHKLQSQIRKTIKKSNLYQQHFKNPYPNIIFIGRITRVKRLELLLKAVRILKEKNEFYNVTIIGNGPKLKELYELSKTLELNDNVWFYGASYDESINAQLIFEADCCVSPGNVGLTAMHSMVYGTPVLTHNNFKNQMPEFEAIKPGLTGDFFNFDNENSIAECIRNWISSHPNRELIRDECYKEIDLRWTPEYQIDILKKIIQ